MQFHAFFIGQSKDNAKLLEAFWEAKFDVMIHKETVDAFVEGVQNDENPSDNKGTMEEIFSLLTWGPIGYTIQKMVTSNDSDLFIYPNIPEDVKNDVRRNFQLLLDEEILYVRDSSFWNNRNQGLVITDCKVVLILDNDDMNNKIILEWENIDYVEYKDECLYFFGYGDRSNNCPIHITHFLKKADEYNKKITGPVFSKVFTQMAKTQIAESSDDILSRTAQEYDKLIEEGKDDEALQLALNFREEQQNVFFTPYIAWAYHKKGQDQKAIQLLDEDIAELAEDNLWKKSELAYCKYSIYEDSGDMLEARKTCLYVVKNAPSDLTNDNNESIQEDATNDFAKYEEYYIQHFLEQPYNERKLIVPVKSYSDLSQKTLSVVDINHLPAIHFPMGHPIANQLYVGHPYIPSNYIPFENYELTFIEDKVREFCQIMQYLGATEINIECINSSSSNKDTNLQQKGSASVNYKLASASGEGERNRTDKFLEDISQSINLHQKFYPKSKPMLPPDLVWYAHEPSWQRLYNQRMQGALMEHEERIETKKSQVVENSELKRISAEVKWLFVEANGNWEQSMEEKFEAHDNAILAIHVKFAPLESLQDSTPVPSQQPALNRGLTMTEDEKEYLEEVKACLEEDSEISPKERRLLNRLRERLGISEKRAEELEASLQSIQLTDDEKEYLEEYKACLEEGEISPKERRLLDRLRDKLGIPEERAKEIEGSI